MRFLPSRPIASARRALLSLALLGAAPALAGPGALVAAIALATAHGHAHHLSVQRDVGHEDIVICHGGAAASAESGAALSRDCQDPDDHRLHATNADRIAPRGDARSDLRHAPAPAIVLAAAARESAGPRPIAVAAPDVAPFGPPPLARTAVLLL